MPIRSDRFERIADDGPAPAADDVAAHLRENPDRAFTPSEIATETGSRPEPVRPTLSRLRDRGRVEHGETRWRIGDDVAVGDSVASGDGDRTSHDARSRDDADHAASAIARRGGDRGPGTYDEWLDGDADAPDPPSDRG